MKKYGLVWWITGILGLALLLVIVLYEIYINSSLFSNQSVTYSQKITVIAGIILICYGWLLLIDNIVKRIRKAIRNKTMNL